MGVDFGKIKSLREQKGLTLQAAADAAGLSNRQLWHQIESGGRTNLTIETLDKLALALDVDPCELLVRARRPGRPAKGSK